MSAPHVLVVGTVLGQPLGGVLRHNQALLPRVDARLRARGGRLTLLAGATPPALELPDTIAVRSTDVPAAPVWRRALVEPRAIRSVLRAEARAGRPVDLVHTAHLPAPGLRGVPLTLTLHDLRALSEPGRRRLVAKHVLRRAIASATTVLAVGEPVRRELEQRFRPRRTALVPNGVDHLPVVPRAPERFLLHVGHLEPRKSLGTVVRTLALDRTLPPLKLVGVNKGDEDARLASLARELGVEARLELVGAVSDDELVGLYARAACVVIPSRLEGFGLPALEALRAGAPLALSREAAAPLQLEADVPCFPAGDAQEAARAIRAALDGAQASPTRVAELVARHTWDAAADALVAAWNEAAARGDTSPVRGG